MPGRGNKCRGNKLPPLTRRCRLSHPIEGRVQGLLGALHIPSTVSNSDLRGVRMNNSKGRGLLSQGVLNRKSPRTTRWPQALGACRGTPFSICPPEQPATPFSPQARARRAKAPSCPLSPQRVAGPTVHRVCLKLMSPDRVVAELVPAVRSFFECVSSIVTHYIWWYTSYPQCGGLTPVSIWTRWTRCVTRSEDSVIPNFMVPEP